MRLREPVLITVIVFVALGVTSLVGDPWATAAVYAVAAGVAAYVYGSRNGE